jgi:hypothetical protein
VQPREAGEPYAAAEAVQEPSERGRLRVAVEPHEVLEDSVAPEWLGGLDATEAKDQGIQEGGEHLAHAVVMVPLTNPNAIGEGAPHPETVEEALDQDEATEVSQTSSAERNREISRAVGAHGPTSLKVQFPRNRFRRHLYRGASPYARRSCRSGLLSL